jgi:hypothetical protein
MTRTESEPGRISGSGTVVLELGVGAGALVLQTAAELNGREIEISREGNDGRTHSVVWPRHVAGCTQYAAVYPGLPPGTYTIWLDRAHSAISVTITAGAVTIADLDTRPTPVP